MLSAALCISFSFPPSRIVFGILIQVLVSRSLHNTSQQRRWVCQVKAVKRSLFILHKKTRKIELVFLVAPWRHSSTRAYLLRTESRSPKCETTIVRDLNRCSKAAPLQERENGDEDWDFVEMQCIFCELLALARNDILPALFRYAFIQHRAALSQSFSHWAWIEWNRCNFISFEIVKSFALFHFQRLSYTFIIHLLNSTLLISSFGWWVNQFCPFRWNFGILCEWSIDFLSIYLTSLIFSSQQQWEREWRSQRESARQRRNYRLIEIN